MKPLGKTGFFITEVQGIGIVNVAATLTIPEPLFLDLLTRYVQAAYEHMGVADILSEVQALGEQYGGPPLGVRMVRVAEKALSSVWSGPCTDIKVGGLP
jgi:hypothetical protein